MEERATTEEANVHGRVQTSERRVCFFTRLTTDQGQSQVRFGVTRRLEAQIITSADSWLRIHELLAADGYVFVDESSDYAELPVTVRPARKSSSER